MGRFHMDINQRALTVDEAAQFTGLSKFYIYELTHQKKIPHNKPMNGRVFLNRMSLKHSSSEIGNMPSMRRLTVAEKKAPQSGGLIRGNDNLTITQSGYSGKIPVSGIIDLEHELIGLMHGTATLTLHVKDGHLTRFTTSRERSFVPGKPTTGSKHL
jgi:excisionase family DNA binding protein